MWSSVKALRHQITPGARLIALFAALLVCIWFYMTWGAHSHWDYILPLRFRKVAALLLVGVAISVSTVVFQTLTENRILTPSIMGFDALYLLVQTLSVFLFGAIRLLRADAVQVFIVNVAVLCLFSCGLVWWLFLKADRGVHLVVLAGIIFGVLFSSLTSFVQRLISPSDASILAGISFARFSPVAGSLLYASCILVGIALAYVALRHRWLDALLLGRLLAINLGVSYRREVMAMLVTVSLLVSVSTALVGPITFFGLLVAHLAYQVSGSPFHRYTVPAAALIGAITLVGGQFVLERLLNYAGTLSIAVDFIGGMLFIVLLVRGNRK